jgi:agmatinase
VIVNAAFRHRSAATLSTVTDQPVGPPSGLAVPRFAGPDTFARLPRLADVGSADVAVLGVPFDGGVSYRPGARFGPAAVRAGSKLLRPYHPALEVEPWTALQVADAGDVTANPFDIREAISQIEAAAEQTYEHAERIIGIGGDHTIALPLLRALHTYHVGIRGPLYGRQDLIDDRKLGFAIASTEDIARHGVDRPIDQIRERVAGLPVYLSIDIDVLDPAHAPGTGTPEPGGLTSRELQFILRGLADLPVVGVDVVEVAPAYDHAELTALAAANVVYECLAMLAVPSRS